MPIRYTLALALLAGAICFGAGYYSRGEVIREVPHEVVRTEVQTKEVEKVVDHVVTKTVTVVKKDPTSGAQTKTTTTETTKTATTNEARTVDKEQQHDQPVAPSPSTYAVAVNFTPRLAADAYVPTGAEFGRRIVGPIWGQVGVDWGSRSVTVGVRAEF